MAAPRNLFLTSKVRLHCDQWAPPPGGEPWCCLFLTSKVRLHCDIVGKYQLPTDNTLFLTSKVRLHCDYLDPPYLPATRRLFLTSKVRLHCDMRCSFLGVR